MHFRNVSERTARELCRRILVCAANGIGSANDGWPYFPSPGPFLRAFLLVLTFYLLTFSRQRVGVVFRYVVKESVTPLGIVVSSKTGPTMAARC
jgi:hypothetical protein